MGNKKLDAALGLTGGIDEFLSDLSIDEGKECLDNIDVKVKESVDRIDGEIQKYEQGGLQTIDIANIQSSLGEIKDLIETSKQTIRKVYESIEDSEIIDSELVSSLGKLIESTHLTIQEYINLYKSRQDFYDTVRLEMLKQQHKMAQMERKHQMNIELQNMKGTSGAIDVPNNVTEFKQEDIVKQLSEIDIDN